MYSAFKLNKQGDNIQPWRTPFPIWNQSVVPCPVLTVGSWPAYKFLKRQIRWSGIPISFRIFHGLLWSTQSKALAYSGRNSTFHQLGYASGAVWSPEPCSFHFTTLPCLKSQPIRSYFLSLLKTMAPHSSTLAWKISWTEEPGRLQSMGSLGVGLDWATSLSLFTFMHWRRKWQPTPVFLPGKSQGRGILVGFHLWGRTESDTTEVT